MVGWLRSELQGDTAFLHTRELAVSVVSKGCGREHFFKQRKYGQICVKNTRLGPSQMSMARGGVGGEHGGGVGGRGSSRGLDV